MESNNVMESQLPFTLENELEGRIAADSQWQEGVQWGKPRHGHPEGTVKAHIATVLNNVDRFYAESPERHDLRLIALVHDTFKHQVDADRSRTGENHHAMRARRFAEQYIKDEPVLEVIELHDEAYNAWQKGNRDGKWDRARERAAVLIERLGDTLSLYVAFYHCDNTTEGKQPDCLEWFRQLCRAVPNAGEKNADVS